jgi:hypothetical protein
MTSRKLLLIYLLEIGGVATLNNLYSPEARTYKGSSLQSRRYFKFYLEHRLIEPIPIIGKVKNRSQEVYYCLTKKGARYIGRPEEYRYKKYRKSPNNVMHESMKFDIALSFLRLYPQSKFNFRYDTSFYGVRPDIVIKVEPKNSKDSTRFFLVEIERKKTIDRVFNEKIKRYEEMFEKMNKNKSHNPSQFTVLFIYTDIWYDVFLRPQQYSSQSVTNHIEQVNILIKNLINHYCKILPEHRYAFMGFHNFYRLNEAVWYAKTGQRVQLVL